MKQRSNPVRPPDEQLHFGRVVADEYQRGFGFVREQGQIRGEVFAHVSVLGWTPKLYEWMVYGIGPGSKNPQQQQVSWASKLANEIGWLRHNLTKFEELALVALSQADIITEREIVEILISQIDAVRTDESFRIGINFLTKIQKFYPGQFEFALEKLISSAGLAEKIKLWSIYGSPDIDTRYVAVLGSAALLSLWLSSRINYYDFDAYRLLIFTLEPNEQLLFLRKTFRLIAEEKIQLTAEQVGSVVRYSRTELANSNVTDYSVDLALTVIDALAKGKHMPREQAIAEVVCRYVDEHTVTLGKFGTELFAPCLGRADKEPIRDYERDSVMARIVGVEYPASPDKKILIINGSERPVLNDEVDMNGELVAINWIITPAYKYQPKKNNPQHKPAGITLCEGRQADVLDSESKLPIWWCCNYPCFKPNQDRVDSANWQNFTLIDFISLLNISFDENEYYAFVGLLNRVNRLLAHLQCRCCNRVLRPAGQSDFNFYRTTRFACSNEQCEENNKVVYLSHCLNGHCPTIIDSRDSKRCTYSTEGFPTRQGMYICQVCGGCCSKDALQRRKQNLEKTHTPESLQYHYQYNSVIFNLEKRLYHWERGRIFCYKCSKQMDESASYYSCSDCKTRYNRGLTHIEFARKKNLLETEYK